MLLREQKFCAGRNKILVGLFVFISAICCADLDVDGEYGQSYRLPHSEGEYSQYSQRGGDWFRTRRQQDQLSQSEDYTSSMGNPQNFHSTLEDSDNFYDGESRYLPAQSVRNRRVYNPPEYSNIGSRDDRGQCKCDLEYVLKYKGVAPRGNYHVKVFHEESGQFQGVDGGGGGGGWQRQTERPYISPPRNTFSQRQGYADVPNIARPQQPRQQQVEYYGEEVDDPGDRRDIFSRGQGSGKPSGPTGGGGGGGRNGPQVERIYYKPRNPRHTRKLAKVARAVVSHSNWATISIISGKGTAYGGYPYGQACRVSDGTPENSTGVPFIYLTAAILDASYQGDLEISRVSLTLSPRHSNHASSEEETCSDDDNSNWTCSSVTLSGRIVQVTSTQEIEDAAEALMTRHPQYNLEAEGFFARLIIKNVVIAQAKVSGNVNRVPLNEYFNTN